jgi:hypothetical protein
LSIVAPSLLAFMWITPYLVRDRFGGPMRSRG